MFLLHVNNWLYGSKKTQPHRLQASQIYSFPMPIHFPSGNYFVRHWRGELSLGISYWANGLLATVLVLFASNTLATYPDLVGLKLFAFLTVLLHATAIIASVWQIVGCWRSASNHVSRGGLSVWATLAKVAGVFGAIQALALFVNTIGPQTIEMVSIITGDKKIPAFNVRVLPGGTEVEFRGGLRVGCATELEKILTAVPQVKVLHINSPGGRIGEAVAIMTLVRARNLTTYTSEYCSSAATLVLMSGKERVVAAGAKVGFHAGTFPGATIEQQQNMDGIVRTIMQSANVSDDFIRRVLATPSDQMWYPSVEEMRSAGVITSQSAEGLFASWGEGGDSSRPVLTNEVARDIGGTYGFFIGQSFSLDAIEQKFADLAPQARIARLQFDSSFASSITNMDTVMALESGEWPKIKTETRAKIAAALGNQTVTPDSARSFVETVSKRAKGEIPSPYIETLLTFHPSYIAKPGREFLDGFKARFTSDGSGKAKGVRFHLDYPKSWSSADGNRPNIVRKFVSQNGRGFEMIMVLVKSLPLSPGQKLTDKDIEDMVAELATPKELKENLPDGASFVSGGPLRLDARPGFYQKYSVKQQWLDSTISLLYVSYTLYYRTSVIQIQCQVGSEAKEEQSLKQRFERFEPLFKLVANSFVIESQWK